MLLSCTGINKFYQDNHVLRSVALTVENQDRIGLVGDNGCGKSTLLRILTEKELPDAFEHDEPAIAKAPNLRIGYLAQNAGLDGSKTVQEEMNNAFAPLRQAKEIMQTLEAKMESGLSEEELDEYARLSAYFEINDGYTTDVRIRTVLYGMGFAESDLARTVSGFSGGEKTRLALCKLLLEAPDLLILDEPTNHLDFQTVGWLEDYLKGWRGALLIVSHDRFFLDRLCTSICELERGELTRYKGNYTAFTKLRAESRERQQKEYEAQQREIAKLEDYVARNKVRASTAKSAKSREKQLEKMERIDRPYTAAKQAKLQFTYVVVPPIDLLEVKNIDLTVGSGMSRKTLMDGISFTVRRGEKIGIIGENGAGKSTLLKVLRNILPHKGLVRWAAGTRLGCFEQESESLNPYATVFDELHDRYPALSDFEVRSLLGQVRLTGENVFKETGVISGGERAKLCFAILMMEHGNVLLLDEPTNHLDLSTKEILEQALSEFDGTILFVSHDRYLLDRIADNLFVMENGTLERFKGKFSAYQEQIRRKTEAEQAAAAEEKRKKAEEDKKSGYRSKEQRSLEAKRRAEQKRIEQEMDALQTEQNTLQESLSDPAVAGDYEKMQQVCMRLEEIRQQQDELLEALIMLEEE
ncbi:MAG: ABC-F family ATP-binding cassette domain-containing protein [Oscillospiraceae bacterium]|nr:ABC-F family ATP-binding cassette domain-containing protein [Oscillospiraceae bacterium]MCR4759806.1 ABC-F family ATP-binding cassette domain-containing protein [Oscillospiraceae bacterium]